MRPEVRMSFFTGNCYFLVNVISIGKLKFGPGLNKPKLAE